MFISLVFYSNEFVPRANDEPTSGDLVEMHEISALISMKSRTSLTWLVYSPLHRIAPLVKRRERTVLCQVIHNL